MPKLVPIFTTPPREFKGHEGSVMAVAVFPDKRRMVTGSYDKTLRLWDLKTGVVLKKMEGHSNGVSILAVSQDGQLIASGDWDGEVIIWHGETGEHLTQLIKARSDLITSLDFSPDGSVLATGHSVRMMKLWNTKTWEQQRNLIECGSDVRCVRYSPSGELLAIATERKIQIYNTGTRERVASFKAHTYNYSLAWTPDGARLLTGGDTDDPTICEWDAMTWQQVSDPWTGHSYNINAIAVNPAGTLVASASDDQHIRLWRLSDRRTIAIFKHSCSALCVTFSMDSKHILSGGSYEKMISEWAVVPNDVNSKILTTTTSRNACIDEDLSTAEELLTQDINTNVNNYTSCAHRSFMMARQHNWDQQSSSAFHSALKEERSAFFLVTGDTALAARDYDRAINLYSAAINLNSASDAIFAKRSKAKLRKGLWMEAFLDAQKVIQLNPSSHVGHKLQHAAFYGAQRDDKASSTFQTMLSKLDNAPDTETRKLRQQYLSPSEADQAIRKVIDAQLDNAPSRVLDTTTGLLCDREAQISTFKSSIEYRELVASTITHRDIQMKHVEEVVMSYFQYVMLSHRWEGKEPLLQDIQGKVVYDLDPVGGIKKLQSFCKTARDLGYRWAWSDTCCIDKSNNVELQESVNSMFIWYHHSALTVVYLSDVPPLSKSGALAKSAWSTRGWTVQEFLAPKLILFYQKDWTLYLDDCTPNHKESNTIMQELEYATGIDRQAVIAFRPGMRGAREKLQWASTRITTLKEDIAYSLCGIFGVRLRVDYGEKKQNALGRLLQEIVAQSGDITALDWVGKSSEFNSCLPADITSYEAPPCKLPSLSEDEIQSSVSSLRGLVAVQSASKLYQTLDSLSAPRFAHRRLHLPCIVFPVTEVRRRSGRDQDTYMYAVKSDGLHDLQITTEDKFTPFSPTRPPPAWQTVLLIRPWSRDLLELHDPADDMQSMDNWSVFESSFHDSPPARSKPVYSDSHSRALRLIVRLRQPFSAFLLARQRDGEFKRIASDHDIIAQVKYMASISYMMDIRTLEIV
ncbi:hypothetical protein BDR05DRAFT_1063130 [Suillus weaverae]|nr:hypothetical protein BDR05DRAFT_1063130 [Suillus weaverae]